MDCSLTESLPEKKRIHSPFGLSYHCKASELPLWAPNSTQLGFMFTNFLHFPLLIKIFLWKNHWSRVRLSSLRIFCPQGQKGHFLGVMSHFGGKVDRLETYWVHICVRKGVGEKTFRNFYLFYFKRFYNTSLKEKEHTFGNRKIHMAWKENQYRN